MKVSVRVNFEFTPSLPLSGCSISVFHYFGFHDKTLHFDFQNIKLSSMRSKAAEDLADEGDTAGAAIVQARNKFLTQVKHSINLLSFI